jgi:hypothetical protein
VIRPTLFLALVLSLAIADNGAQASAQCSAKSTLTQRPLVELFTSEGCSSCPPADRWLSAQMPNVKSGKISAIAWHVDYWDQLGWVDPLGIAEATPRQRLLAKNSRSQVYTPGVFLNAREWRNWSSGKWQASALPAPNLQIDVMLAAKQLTLQAHIGELKQNAQLHVVVQRLNQSSQVQSGENSGRLLHHDFSAAATQARPVNTASAQQSFVLPRPPGALAVTAFLESTEGMVLQSTQLLLEDCQ